MISKLVIDTNVAISANGRNTHASMACQFACLELLESCRELNICLDNQNLIMDEYAKHLSYSGQPDVGDMFFKYLHDNQYSSKKIHRVKITPIADIQQGFEELSKNQLDPSDRKFLATAVVSKATIVNATDSDWKEQQALLESLNIVIKQLCPEHCHRS